LLLLKTPGKTYPVLPMRLDLCLTVTLDGEKWSVACASLGATRHRPKSRRSTETLRFNGHFPGEPGLAGVY